MTDTKWTASYWHVNSELTPCNDGPHAAHALNPHSTYDDDGEILEVPQPAIALGVFNAQLISGGMALIPLTDTTNEGKPLATTPAIDYTNPDGGYAMFFAVSVAPPLRDDMPMKLAYGEAALIVVIHEARRDMTTHFQTYQDRVIAAELERTLNQ